MNLTKMGIEIECEFRNGYNRIDCTSYPKKQKTSGNQSRRLVINWSTTARKIKQVIAYQTTISKLVQLFWVTTCRQIYLFIYYYYYFLRFTPPHSWMEGLWDPTIPTAAAKAPAYHRAMEDLWVNLTHYTNASNVCSTARKSRSYGEFPMRNWPQHRFRN
jgi:hypothetical protein